MSYLGELENGTGEVGKGRKNLALVGGGGDEFRGGGGEWEGGEEGERDGSLV